MIRTVGKMKDADGEWIVVFSDTIAPLHVDLFTELFHEEGLVRMSFAAVTQHGDGTRKADVVVSLRMSEDLAFSLCRALRELQEVK
ncbi:hypothetical protein [Rhizobium lentis]|uniref:hypothetical protein n=1 Tax=Rhizobium lentis TaxID=1138194 RepID=UPI002180D048|nr:hypothetical protein [Rhizobium lentis]